MNLKLNFFSILLVILFVVYFFGCEELAEPKQQKYPLIQTNKVSSIDSTGVVFNGEILRQGTDEVLYFGFVWATSSKPTIDDFKIVLGNEAQSSFSIKVSFDLISGKNYVVRFFAVTANNIIYGNDETFTSSGSSRPTITSFVPKNGIDADTVLIIGENFGSNPSANIVKVGTFSASILSATNKSIKFLIPKIPQGGSYKIEVTTSAKSVRSSDSFVIENPIVSSFTPTKGSDGTVITISGDFFSLNKDYNKVYLGNTLCQIIESSRNQLKIYSPYTQVVGNVKVVANVNGKATSSVADYFIEGPYITDINPLEGSYKNVVHLKGEGFSSSLTENIVSFGSLVATVLTASKTEMSVIVPDLPGGYFAISVKRGNKFYSYPNSFSVNNSWKTVNNSSFPGGKRGMATGFSIGNRGFITLGRVHDYDLFKSSGNMQIFNDVWEFNSLTNSWIQRPNFPGEARYYATSFTIGSKAYVGGGVSNYGSLLSDFYEYDSELNTWKKISNMPGIGRYGAVGFSAGGNGYVGLGNGDINNQKDFIQYDPFKDSWRQFNGPGTGSAFDFAFSILNRGFVVINGKELWELDVNNLTWNRKADYPDNSPFGSFVFAIAGKAYAGSGFYSAFSTLSYSRNFYRYDAVADEWSELEGFEYLKRYTGVAFGLNGRGYVLTGQSNAPNIGSWPYYYVNDFWMFTP